MHAYSHAAAGYIIGRILFPDDRSMTAAITLGSTISDFPVLIEGARRFFFVKDKEVATTVSVWHNAAHSIFVWFVIGAFCLTLCNLQIDSYLLLYRLLLLIASFSLGAFLHNFVDLLSHTFNTKRTGKFEIFATTTYMWPFPCQLKQFRLFDYRNWLWDPSGKTVFSLITTPELLLVLGAVLSRLLI